MAQAYRRLPASWRERVARRYVGYMADSARFPTLPVAEPRAEFSLPSVEVAAGQNGGVNLFAYFRGQFGLGEAARLYAASLIQAGYPIALNDIDIELPHGFNDLTLGARLSVHAPHAINVIFVNPDYFEVAVGRIGRARMQGRYLIACWFWELERVPDAWLPAIDLVDEIMVASTFIEQAFRKVTDKPITRVVLPLCDSNDSGLGRADFGLDEEDFIFLTSFDFHSWVERKNPIAAVDAFRMAFPDQSKRVKLLIKTSNGTRHPEAFSNLLKLSRMDPRIIVRDGILDRNHLRSLQRCSDVYVSLHRAEGFGLGLAECMALGKPVVATAWSGNLDFMTEENSCLVGFRLIDVGPGEYLHGDTQRWAEPDLVHAAAHMQRLFGDRRFAEDTGNRAAADVARMLSPHNAARQMTSRFDEILASMPPMNGVQTKGFK